MKKIIKIKVFCIQVKTKLIKLAPKKYKNKMVKRIIKDMLEITKLLKDEYKKIKI